MELDKVSYEEFSRLDFRIGRVLEAEKLEGSNKLLKLRIDIGGEIRQSIAGVAEQYTVEKLKNKLVAIIVNLKPRKVFGEVSEVMLLAALDNDDIALVGPDKQVSEGSKIS